MYSLYRSAISLCLATLLLPLSPTLNAEDRGLRLSSVRDNPAARLALTDDPLPALSTTLQADGYVFFNDNERLLDNLKSIYDEGLALQGRSRGLLVIPGDETALVEQMEKAAGDKTSFAAGGHFTLLTSSPDWLIVGGSEFAGSGRFDYDEGDAARLRFATVVGLFSFGQLQSTMEVSALWRNYLGANYQFDVAGLPSTRFGVTAKLQSFSLIERSIAIAEYDEDKLFDRSRDVDHKVQLNADVGVQHSVGRWLVGLSLEDVLQQSMRGPEGTRYQQRSVVSAQLYRRGDRVDVFLDADLTPRTGFGELASRREVGLGTILPVSEKFDLTLGYRWIDSGHHSDVPSAGLHYRLQDLLRIEVQVQYAGPREFGAGLNLQLPL